MIYIHRAIIPFFIFLILVLTIPHDAVVKGAVTTLTNWDDELQGSWNGITGLINYTRTSGDDFEVNTDEPVHGSNPYALKIYSERDSSVTPDSDQDDEGWINLTENISYIGQIEIRFQMYINSGPTWGQIQWVFYNNSVEVLNIRMHTDTDIAPDGRFLIKNSVGAWINAFTGGNYVQLNSYEHCSLIIRHNGSSIMNYTFNENYDATSGTRWAYDVSTASGTDWVTFDSIFINATHEKSGGTNDAVQMDIDDIIIDTEPTGGFYSCDMDRYDMYHNLDVGMTESAIATGYLFLEFREPVFRTETITGFDLHVADNTRAGSTTDDYHLYVTGIPVGVADDLIEVQNGWIVRWCGFNVTIEDEHPVFEVKCDSNFIDIWSGLYTGYNPKQYVQAMHSWDDYRYGNGDVDGTEISRYNYVKWSYYYDTIVPYEEAPEFEDEVFVTGNFISENTFYQYDPIWVNWFAENVTSQNWITIYDSSGVRHLHRPVDTYSGSFQWTPTQVGEYTANLYRVNNRSSDNFSVIINPSGNGIWSFPNPESIGTNYNVYWNFSYNSGLDGVIYRSYDNNPATATFFRYVDSNSSGNFSTVEIRDELVTYWFLGIEHPTRWSLIKTHIHYNLIEGIPANSLEVAYDNVYWDDSCEGKVQHIYVTHRHFGSTVRLYDGNRLISSSSEYMYTHSYEPEGIGFHQIYMYVVDAGNGTETMISNVSFNLMLTCEEGTWRDVFPKLHPTLGMIVGIIVTSFFTLIPFMLSLGFKAKQIKIPPIMYTMFASMGVIISVYFEFFEPYVLFFVLAIGVIVITIMYLQHKGVSG